MKKQIHLHLLWSEGVNFQQIFILGWTIPITFQKGSKHMCSTSAHHKPSLEWARGGWVPHAQSNLGKPPLCRRALSRCSSQSLSKGQGRAAAAVLRCLALPAPFVPRPRPETHQQSLHSRQHLEPDGPNYRPDQDPMRPRAFLIRKCCPAPEVIHLT